MSANQAWLEIAIAKYLTGKLTRFRADLERGTDQPIDALHFNAALLLSDLCRFLGLDEEQHNQVLGERGVQHVSEVLGTRVWARKPARSLPKPTVETAEQLTLPLAGVDSP